MMESLKRSIQRSWRETDKNKSLFLQRRNIRVKIIDFVFLFIYLPILNLELGYSMTLYVTVTINVTHVTVT